jgi:alpha-L-fucosidase
MSKSRIIKTTCRSGILLFSIFLTIQGWPQADQNQFNPVTPVSTDDTPESIALKAAHVTPSPRQAAWQELEVTCFLHFGLNTFTNREWGLKNQDPALFNPTALDANQWAEAAKLAGAKLMIIVAKHHDGFCLWPTKYTDYSVKASPWRNGKGDVVAEVAAACKSAGLKLGIYLSPWDISSPLYGTDEYNTHFKNQLRELLTGYGEVAEVWFDGACGEGPNGKRQVYDWAGYYRLVRELQPGAVIAITGPDVRWVGNESGDGNETEWSVVQDSAGLRWYPSEVDVSIRPGWFYHSSEDTLVKSPEELVDIYYKSVGRNAVLLLNIPPDKRGLVHENDIRSLRGMRSILDSTFRKNFLDDAEKTPLKECQTGSAGFDLGSVKTFDCLMLQENFRHGQRVEEFSLEASIDGTYREICHGTTIGYKRLMRFEPVTARYLRLKILKSRAPAEISGFGLYLAPGK